MTMHDSNDIIKSCVKYIDSIEHMRVIFSCIDIYPAIIGRLNSFKMYTTLTIPFSSISCIQLQHTLNSALEDLVSLEKRTKAYEYVHGIQSYIEEYLYKYSYFRSREIPNTYNHVFSIEYRDEAMLLGEVPRDISVYDLNKYLDEILSNHK